MKTGLDSKKDRDLSYLLLVAIFFSIGSFLEFISYSSVEPMIVAAIFLMIGSFVVMLCDSRGGIKTYAYQLIFSINWVTAGCAAVFANLLRDPFHLDSDASTFYEVAISDTRNYDLEALKSFIEGSGVIILWREVYDLFEFFGFQKLHYVGISMNVMLVSFTGVMAVHMTQILFENDTVRQMRMILLFSCCGLFWLFSSLHMRDALVLFSVTILMMVWVQCLNRASLWQILKVLILSLVSYVTMEYLRKEFLFVPFALACAGFIALLFDSRIKGWKRALIYIILPLLLIPVTYMSLGMQAGLSNSLISGYSDYSELSTYSSGDSSLGASVIVNAPLPLRLILGSIYLFIFPIPFWSGFQTGSIYNVFKSLHAMYMYFLTPLILYSMIKIIKFPKLRTGPVLFLSFTLLGFVLAVAATSLETRHFGVFLVPAMVLALIPDFQLQSDRILIKSFISFFLIFIFSIHLVWAILKM